MNETDQPLMAGRLRPLLAPINWWRAVRPQFPSQLRYGRRRRRPMRVERNTGTIVDPAAISSMTDVTNPRIWLPLSLARLHVGAQRVTRSEIS